MAIKGSLKEASLPDVLQLLSMGQKTGCLSVADRNNFGYVYFDHGFITYASIVNRRDRLGDILVKGGLITPEQLQAAIERQTHERDKRLGELLVDMEAISRPDLERYMRVQIEEAVYYLFTWMAGSFSFEPDVQPEEQDFLVRITPESLLLEGARRVDEWSLIEKKIPSFDLIFVVDRSRLAASGVSLTAEQQRLLPLLDGRRDVASLIDDSGLLEFDVGKALYGLITAGFAHRLGKTQADVVPVGSDARVEEHRNLGLAFYKTAMYDEAGREFRRVVDLRPADPQAHFYIGLVALRQGRWGDAVDALRLAAEKGSGRPEVLHNLGVALEQLGRLAEAEAAFAEAAARASDDWRVMLGWGIVALKRGQGDAAVERLDRARALAPGGMPPSAIWYWARSLAAVMAGSEAEALPIAEEGLSRFPHSAALRNNVAVLCERRGELERAEQLLTAALEEEPSLPQLSKNLGDLYYRSGRHEDALTAYERAVKLAPRLGDDVYFKLGNLAFREKRPTEAAAAWKEALVLNPAHELARANLATLDHVS
jgi:tetratricopeptide (TPR) repeat protein